MFCKSKHQRGRKAVRRLQRDYERFDCHHFTARQALAYLYEANSAFQWVLRFLCLSPSHLSSLFPTSSPLLILTWVINSFLFSHSIFSLNYFVNVSGILLDNFILLLAHVWDGKNCQVIFSICILWNVKQVKCDWSVTLHLIAFLRLAN